MTDYSIKSLIDQNPAYFTQLGAAYHGDSRELLAKLPDESINLVLTSPPFALQRQKEYGNKSQDAYVDWLLEFARLVYKKLHKSGSFVLDLGGAYEQGVPVRSLYNFRALIRLCDELGFRLAEDFYWFNPSKLPSPIEWVNKRKLRAKDSVDTIWWLAKTDFPKANIGNVLAEYSTRMKTLLKDPEGFYTPARRPSGHDISKGFAKDNGGAIPSNLLQISNSESNGSYLAACKALNVKPHPARFPSKLPAFFIKLLTDEQDIVLDIFAGSNTTGHTAEILDRRWISFDVNLEYLATSCFRFFSKVSNEEELRNTYRAILRSEAVDLNSCTNGQGVTPRLLGLSSKA